MNGTVACKCNFVPYITRMAESLKRLDENVVHKMCAGQVITSMAIAVKELIENSLDAGAKKIHIRLTEYGSATIQVCDDGPGVEEKHFQSLALLHYTSKIKDFADIYSLRTFGFRGEALNSLCAVSDVEITTRSAGSGCGTKLKFDNKGAIVSQKLCAGVVGTIVLVKSIFYTLPVRRNVLLSNLKREFHRTIEMIKAYGLVASGVRITCVSEDERRRTSTLVSTNGSTCVRDNIGSIFGYKQVENLLVLQRHTPNEELMKEFNISEKMLQEDSIDFEGFISNCAHGEGRNIRDRQFLYVNSRPCDHEKIIKIVNSVYHKYYKNKYPFLFLNIKVSSGNVDVNCAPDKRQIFLKNEKIVLVTLKASLLELYRAAQCTYTVNEVKATVSPVCSGSDKTPCDDRFVTSTPCSKDQVSSATLFQKYASSSARRKLNVSSEDWRTPVNKKRKSQSTMYRFCNAKNDSSLQENYFSCATNEISTDQECSVINEGGILSECEKSPLPTPEERLEELVSPHENLPDGRKEGHCAPKKNIICSNTICRNEDRTNNIFMDVDVISHLRKNETGKVGMHEEVRNNESLVFKASLIPSHNKEAVQELRQISKDMFLEMEIIGQYNLGFIVVRLLSDLFIIDQHAADEIYNFETLCKSTVLENQKLVVPQQLQLSSMNEMILIENLEIFKKNGFDFIINCAEEYTKKVSLSAIPMSKDWTFGKDDIDELIGMLQDTPGVMCRPSRVRAMFASRACRKSVMIGSALPFPVMQRIVRHLGEIDEPWNCPHGRPTMRHLCNLNSIIGRTVLLADST